MRSCAIQNLFWRNSSAWHTLQCIPYKRLEQNAPSWSAGQLKSSKSENQQNCMEKLEYLHEFLSNSDSVSTEFKRSIYSIIHTIQASWSNHFFLKRWSVEVPQLSTNCEIEQKNLDNIISSWPIWMICHSPCSAWLALQYVPYNRFDPRTPS